MVRMDRAAMAPRRLTAVVYSNRGASAWAFNPKRAVVMGSTAPMRPPNQLATAPRRSASDPKRAPRDTAVANGLGRAFAGLLGLRLVAGEGGADRCDSRVLQRGGIGLSGDRRPRRNDGGRGAARKPETNLAKRFRIGWKCPPPGQIFQR
jgi:hypothetical protein